MLNKLIVSIILICACANIGVSDDTSICMAPAGCRINVNTGHCPDCIGADELPVAGLVYGKVNTSIVTAVVGRDRIYGYGEFDITLFNGVYTFMVTLTNGEIIEWSSSSFRSSDFTAVLEKVYDWRNISQSKELVIEKHRMVGQSSFPPEWYIYFGGAHIVVYLKDKILMFDISDIDALMSVVVVAGKLEKQQRKLISDKNKASVQNSILVNTLLN